MPPAQSPESPQQPQAPQPPEQPQPPQQPPQQPAASLTGPVIKIVAVLAAIGLAVIGGLTLIGLRAGNNINTKPVTPTPTVQSGAATGNGQLYLTPATASLAAGSSFTVAIRENSQNQYVNAVQANLTYPSDKFDYVSASGTGSGFEIAAETSGKNGVIKVSRGTTTPKKGDQLIATLTLKAKASGAATLAFTAGTALVSSVTNQNVLGSSSPASLQIH